MLFENTKLDLIKGQRGKPLLVVDGYTFSQNNLVGLTTYWCCRVRRKGHQPCRARVMTTEMQNGLHRIIVRWAQHNHLRTGFLRKKIKVKLLHQSEPASKFFIDNGRYLDR